ncbi:hypothetical protein RB25_22935 [Herbaspirillum rubrisubalbicans]|uniref:DUF3828 domain-containing protein n=1 Tax=Herbaspirillum rubrisubalbicans TaxID=80842 RepID=A0ABX9BXB9_9BURK|nr:DUF3828 domain-containing protein [Herbaspirillum rubrisubalbicans]RAM62587.1 hypothetical protein RB24_19940 [Herbaspirillum rubrisubalbicans]RAN43623.1 hypothetical protein RB25_22935 [Herbaspirillum rubrisubalbicans]
MTTLPRFAFSPARYLRAGACALGMLLALSGCNNFSGDEQQQADVIGDFYRIHLKNAAPGLPSADELKQFQPLVSRALYALLTRAEAAEARYVSAAGGVAAPLIEGDLFTSLYEGATSFAVQSCDSENDRASCQVAFRYQKQGSDESWNDKILLVREERQWRIDDIEFIGNDQSSQREYLSDNLNDAIQQAE